MEVPDFVQLRGGDNRVVPLPVWMAKDILDMLESYIAGEPRTNTPCYRAEQQERYEDLEKLIELTENPVNNSGS
jgi:hypothetical protein